MHVCLFFFTQAINKTDMIDNNQNQYLYWWNRIADKFQVIQVYC